jgi:prepilin-type N-terminal cleavage/methylation domain-containing protein
MMSRGSTGETWRRGLTLLELLIAVALLTFLMIPIWGSLVGSRETITLGQHDLEILDVVASFRTQARTYLPERFPDADDVLLVPTPTDTATTSFWVTGQAGLPEILLPAWNAEVVEIRYSADEFPMVPTPSGQPRLGRRLRLVVKPDRTKAGTERVFPVIIPPPEDTR